ncbi:MAG: hypothetical protein KF756_12240 [Acidobacteria bacterium]|nr:hypothetical protein [Acidobacteriota bacterium]
MRRSVILGTVLAASAALASACSNTPAPNTQTPVKPVASPTASASPTADDKKGNVNGTEAKPGLPTTSEPKPVDKKDGEKTDGKTADKPAEKPADVKKAN